MTIASYVGARVKRKEDPRLIQGEATYVGDVQLPRTLYAQFIRSPHAHARFKITSPNFSSPDIKFFQWADFKDTLNFSPVSGGLPNRPLLADEEVRMVGEAVALVIASAPQRAADAVEQVKVE